MTTMWRMRFLGAVACAALVAGGCERKDDTRTASTRPTKSSETSSEQKPPAGKSANRPASDRQPHSPDSQPAESQSEPSRPASASSAPDESNPASGEVAAGEIGQVDPADLAMPKVLLSNAEIATCLVGVGDPMPAITLPDLAGKAQPLAQLLGERLTVVAFWRDSNPYAMAELADLGPDVAQHFGRRGVRVVAIDESDSPDQVRQIVQKLGLKFPVLLDAKGEALAKVATRKLPRTYLLDATGKIVWFDIEYSRSTRRDLHQAIQFLLSQD